MRTLLLSISCLAFAVVHCLGQASKYPIPKGYWPFLSVEDKPFEVSDDFDNDGINDLAKIFTKSKDSDETNIVVVYLSSIYYHNKTYSYFPLESYNYSLSFDKKSRVLMVSCALGTGRFHKDLKFKYYSNLGDMRLIGYDEESFGNAVHDGAYVKTVNLLTNKYDISKPNLKNKITKQISIPIITLQKIDVNNLSYLNAIGANYIQN